LNNPFNRFATVNGFAANNGLSPSNNGGFLGLPTSGFNSPFGNTVNPGVGTTFNSGTGNLFGNTTSTGFTNPFMM